MVFIKKDIDIIFALCSGRSLFDLKIKEVYLIKSLKPEDNNRYETIQQLDSDRYQIQSSEL